MKRLHSSLFLILFIITVSCFGFSSKPPTRSGAVGAPDNGQTCISCHGSSGNGSLVISNLPNQYKPGEKYAVSTKLSQSGRRRWGFIMTALDENGQQAGTFENIDAKTQVFSSSGRQYISHTSSGTAAGQANSNTWLLNWTAPEVDVGKISFYASGNAANNNGDNTGDNGYKTEVTIEAEVEAGVNIPDANLRAKLEPVLDKGAGEAITDTELATLSGVLDASASNISDLTGLQHCTNLTQLYLYNNQISDISLLSNLTNLTDLSLEGNPLTAPAGPIIQALKDGGTTVTHDAVPTPPETIHLSPGWNMISIPGQPLETDPVTLQTTDNSLILPLYGWNPTAFSYEPVTELKFSEGYWALTTNPEGTTLEIVMSDSSR